jgi:hypothetical protein
VEDIRCFDDNRRFFAVPRPLSWRAWKASNLRKWVAENALLLVFTGLFVLCLAGQALAGHSAYNQTQLSVGQPAISLPRYIRTGTFLQGMFENWQAAILQLGSLIVFGIFLHQRGAPHSLRDGTSKGSRARVSQRSGGKTKPAKRPRWFHDNSLSIVFAGLFALVFVFHLLAGHAANNSLRVLLHEPPQTVMQFFRSSQFWFITLQTWEAEYMAIALYVLLSIYLRQQGSPESKPADASNADTGDPNQ